MKQILKHIYENEIYTSQWMQRDTKNVETVMEERLKSFDEKLSAQESEELRDIFYEVLEQARQKAFRRGIQYTVQFLTEAMQED